MRYLACAVVALTLAACALGGGPQLVVSRGRVAFGAQAGVGFGTANREDSTAFRADLGFVAGDDGYGIAAGTLLFHKHDGPGGPGGGGALSVGRGSGFLLAGGLQGGWFDLAQCDGGDAWTVTIAARIVGDERQLVIWPQYGRWIPYCLGGP